MNVTKHGYHRCHGQLCEIGNWSATHCGDGNFDDDGEGLRWSWSIRSRMSWTTETEHEYHQSHRRDAILTSRMSCALQQNIDITDVMDDCRWIRISQMSRTTVWVRKFDNKGEELGWSWTLTSRMSRMIVWGRKLDNNEEKVVCNWILTSRMSWANVWNRKFVCNALRRWEIG